MTTPPSSPTPDHLVVADASNSIMGFFPQDHPPAVRVASGATVRIDAVNQFGVHHPDGPTAYFAELGVDPADVLPELEDIARLPRPDFASGHVLTGPVYVEDARPGSVLRVDILDISPRVDYGVNVSGHGSGVLPDLLEGRHVRLLRLDTTRSHYDFEAGIRVPFRPFSGITAVAPPDSAGDVSANPPDRWGGNMDIKDFVAGSTLYFPVFQPGGQFWIGDTHGAQGHGEVNQTAVEHSMSFTARFTVEERPADHGPLEWPRAKVADHWVLMGAHEDLDVALEIAVQQAIDFLVEYTAGALDTAAAYSLCSIAVDFVVGEAVDGNKLVAAYVPDHLLEGF
ncbi:acetamidase/formamidase family protein [Brevibacterium litoralis]|uniref:acetamidase/formamidase family protein n=1 Tax=Brevibacterium litoralis TaxID=3138935 RepID=UPI0032EF2DC3